MSIVVPTGRPHDRRVHRNLQLALLASFTSCALAAHAADPATAGPTPSSTGSGEALQEVVVTGSRIAQPNMTSVSPIQMVSSQEIQLQGTTDIQNLLNTLPQSFQNSQSDISATQNPLASAGGISTADLRGLGPQRTLVLVDGRRLGIGDASTLNPNPAPDLNQIPPQLVDRIDVVTGGASAVYGSDAIAGVVNFIMKHDFQGVQLDAQYGIDQHDNHNSLMEGLEQQAGFTPPTGSTWDGQSRSFTLVMGQSSADDKGNVEAYFTYRDADPVSQGSRDFSACKLNVNPTTSTLINSPGCDGSPNSNLFVPVFNPNTTCPYGYCLTILGNRLLPWPQSGSSPPSIFNSSTYQTLQTQDTRYMAGLFSHYDLNDYVKPYFDFSFMKDTSTTRVAPSGSFFGSNPNDPTGNGGLLVNCAPTNPLLSAQENAALCGNAANGVANYPSYNNDSAVDVFIGRRNIEGGPRISDYEHTNYRAVSGFKGDFDAWTYDAYASYYSTYLFQGEDGFLSFSKLQQSLLVVSGPNGPACQNTNGGCVPYNIWTQGGVTPAALNYLTTVGTSQGTVTERIVAFNTTGQLGKYGITSPLATDGVAVNIGTEHRNDQLQYQPDAEELADDLSGFSGAGVSINNGYDVQEEFIELRAPIAESQPWADQLTVGGAFRHSNYSTSGGVNTYKFDLEYAPIKDLLIRGSFDRAIRAPNLIELYTPDSVTNTTVVASDPCAGAAPTASLANCMHTGVTASEYGHIPQCPAGQCSTLLGGNADLQPEKANTLSYGLTFSPSFVPGFSASLDYYKIIVRGEVGDVPQDITFNKCLNTGNPTYCQGVVRTPSGLLFGTTISGGGYIKATNVNIATAEVAGVDLQLAYRWDVGAFGKMSATFAGTYLQHQTSQPLPTESTYDCASLYGPTCQTVDPRWRHNARITWETPYKLLFSLQWRYIGSTKLDTNTGNPELQATAAGYGPGVYDSFDARLPDISYIDLSALWDVNEHLTLRAGVNNLLDKDPPLVSSLLAQTGAPNTYPTYDYVGRQLFVALKAKF